MPSVRLMIPRAERFPSVVKLQMEGVPGEERYVRVVRCRDCEHASELGDGTLDCHGPLAAPWDYYADQPQVNVVEPGGFCAWAERRA